MKFFAFALALASIVSAQVVCTDEDATSTCGSDGACCGYLDSVEGETTRACSDKFQMMAVECEGDCPFTCLSLEEGASKLALGLSAIVATIYLA